MEWVKAGGIKEERKKLDQRDLRGYQKCLSLCSSSPHPLKKNTTCGQLFFNRQTFGFSPGPCHWYWAECCVTVVVCVPFRNRCCSFIFSFILSCPSETWAGGWKLSLFITVRNRRRRGPRWPTQKRNNRQIGRVNKWTSASPSLGSHGSVKVTTSAWIRFRNLTTFNRFPPLIVVHLLGACQSNFSNQSAGCGREEAERFFGQRKTYRCRVGGKERWEMGRKGKLCLGNKTFKRKVTQRDTDSLSLQAKAVVDMYVLYYIRKTVILYIDRRVCYFKLSVYTITTSTDVINTLDGYCSLLLENVACHIHIVVQRTN